MLAREVITREPVTVTLDQEQRRLLAGGGDEEVERRVDAVLAEVGLGDWLVEVTDGRVALTGPRGSAYRMTACVVTESVPGVVEVEVRT